MMCDNERKKSESDMKGRGVFVIRQKAVTINSLSIYQCVSTLYYDTHQQFESDTSASPRQIYCR